MRKVDVAIARTSPQLADRQEVREIEALCLTAIGHARRTIYLESQYLASRKIAEALASRLGEPDGPEIVIVLPKEAVGWLEHKAMDGARQKLLRMLWRADAWKRFGAFYPVTAGSKAIYVHAKIMVIDDSLLRVGSSNLNNRSLGFDTECDLAVEVALNSSDEDQLRQVVLSIRHDLLCEHLAVQPTVFTTALEAASGSVLKTVESLRGSGRTLKPFEPAEVTENESILAENELMDPEQASPCMTKRLWGSVTNVIDGIRPRRS